jgi:lysozyme
MVGQGVDRLKEWAGDGRDYMIGSVQGLAADARGAMLDLAADHDPDAGAAIARANQARAMEESMGRGSGQAAGGQPAAAQSQPMRPSASLLSFMQGYERFSPTTYSNDGANTPTIGWGHKLLLGEAAHYAQTGISAPAADALFEADLKSKVDAVRRHLTRPVTQNQFDALVSLAFNAGEGAVDPRTSTLMRMVNAGNFEGAAEQFGRWNHANGKALKGLSSRRASEQKIFTDGIYDSGH